MFGWVWSVLNLYLDEFTFIYIYIWFLAVELNFSWSKTVSRSIFYLQLSGGEGKLGLCGGLGTFGGGNGGLFDSFWFVIFGTGGGGIFGGGVLEFFGCGTVGSFDGGSGGRFDGLAAVLDAILALDLYRSSLRLNPS